MKRFLALQILLLAVAFDAAAQVAVPTNAVILSGDRSAILHWDPDASPNVSGYNVYRSVSSGGPFVKQNTGLLTTLGFCDLNVSDGQTYYYQVTAVNTTSQTSPPSATVSTVPNPFSSDDDFLDYLQQANFGYFWYTANPNNGLVPDRMVNSTSPSACSIAAVGFGLTAIGIGIDHGWITRTQGVARVLTTLNTFLNGPQGPGTSGTIGYEGWFYHFLDLNTATRVSGSELSSIDTTLLLGGVLYAKQYFNGTNADETNIRSMADTIFNRVNWTFMAQGTDAVAMGWQPTSGFSGYGNWVGYDEGMILYLLGLGTATNPLPASAWNYWTSGYTWVTYYGESFVPFPPLFGHEYSHCWIDFRHIADAYMNSQSSTYFENSRRAALAQQSPQMLLADRGAQVGLVEVARGLRRPIERRAMQRREAAVRAAREVRCDDVGVQLRIERAAHPMQIGRRDQPLARFDGRAGVAAADHHQITERTPNRLLMRFDQRRGHLGRTDCEQHADRLRRRERQVKGRHLRVTVRPAQSDRRVARIQT